MSSLVVMGVAGCGKSSLASAVARALELPLIEGDDFHSAENQARMRAGIPLTDADRSGWLDALAAQLASRPRGAVLTCSALRRAYRQRLRAAVHDLRFAHLVLTREESARRVGGRAEHLFPTSLVASQFATLESPAGEAGVLELDATRPMAELVDEVTGWLAGVDARAARSAVS